MALSTGSDRTLQFMTQHLMGQQKRVDLNNIISKMGLEENRQIYLGKSK